MLLSLNPLNTPLHGSHASQTHAIDNLIAEEIIRLPKNSNYRFTHHWFLLKMVPFIAASEETLHKPGLRNERLSLSLFSTLRALNCHDSTILARRTNLWLPFCSSYQADSKCI